jgi:cell division protein FtsA
VIGSTDRDGGFVTSKPIAPADVAHTIFTALGIDPQKQLITGDGRPVEILDRGETIEVPSVGGGQPRVLSRQILAEIVEPRVEEIFMLVQHEIQKCGLEEAIASGVVITGGSTLLSGMTEMAEEVLGVPVRRGMPKGIGGLVDVVRSPVFATAVGLVIYGAQQRAGSPYFKIREDNVYRKVKNRMKEWLGEIF